MARNSERQRELQGHGPWVFEQPDDLEPGESWALNFRDMKHRKQKGYFRQFLPLDDLQVTNADPGNDVQFIVNHTFEGRVQANASESLSDEGLTHLQVENVGNSTISAGSVTVEVTKNAYGADEQAREQASRGVVEKAITDIVPGL